MATTEVQFRLAGGANPLILVPVFANGRGPYEFILDTGASSSLLTPELAAELGVRTVETKEAMGAGGKVRISLGQLQTLAVGGTEEKDVAVAITDEIHRVGTAVGAKIDGDLGYNFLRHYRLTLDYRHTRLRLESHGDGVLPERQNSVNFKLAAAAKPLILLPLRVEGLGPYQFALDTGTSTSVISSSLARELGLAMFDAPPLTGAGGQIRASAARVRSLELGGAEVSDLTVISGDFLQMLSEAAGARLDGIVGYDFLRGFRVTIDYPLSQLHLEPVR